MITLINAIPEVAGWMLTGATMMACVMAIFTIGKIIIAEIIENYKERDLD